LHRPRGNCGVDSVATRLENAHAGFGSEGMTRRDHAVLRDDRRPPAAAGRLGIVLRLGSNERDDDSGDNDEGLFARHSILQARDLGAER